MIHLAISGIAAAVVIYYLYLFYKDYTAIASQPGEWKGWERLWAAGRGSATKLWARVVGIVASIIAAAAGLAPMLGAPEVSDFIKANFEPQTVTIVMVGIMVVVELARNRTS